MKFGIYIIVILSFFGIISRGRASQNCAREPQINTNDIKKISSACSVSEDAQKMIERFEKNGFSCTHGEDESRALQCTGKVIGYPENVRVYFSPDYKESKKKVSANYFFHGFRSAQTFSVNKNDTKNPSDFAAQFKEALNTESILIIPESQGRCETYGQFFQDGAFKKFHDEVSKIASIKFDAIKLAGHSGAYRVLDQIIKKTEIKSKVKKILFLDSIYGDLPGVKSWLKESAANKIKVAYVVGAEQSTVKPTEKFFSETAGFKDQMEILQIQSTGLGGAHMQAIRSGGLVDFLKP